MRWGPWTGKDILKVAAVLAVMFGIFMFLVLIGNDPIDPVTVEQVCDVLESQGYDPVDTTRFYRDKWSDIYQKLTSAVSVSTSDFEFTFFVFDSGSSAVQTYRSYRSWIRNHRFGVPNAEHDTLLGNCAIYWIKTHGTYTVDIRIANTVVFAWCDEEEHISKINHIINAIGYFLN